MHQLNLSNDIVTCFKVFRSKKFFYSYRFFTCSVERKYILKFSPIKIAKGIVNARVKSED